jgi:PadR family transcriptional regulator PadR
MGPLEEYLRKLERELKTGLLSVLVLSVLQKGGSDQYGYQIIEQLKESTGGALAVPEGTIYPILHALHGYGLVRTRWGVSENGPPRKYYRLTEDGKRAFEEGVALWRALVDNSEEVLGSREAS